MGVGLSLRNGGYADPFETESIERGGVRKSSRKLELPYTIHPSPNQTSTTNYSIVCSPTAMQHRGHELNILFVQSNHWVYICRVNNDNVTNTLSIMTATIKFKHEEHKVSTLKARLKSFYKLATPEEQLAGRNWYREMYNWVEAVAEARDMDVMQACGIFAALSPQMSVDRNKALFMQYVKTGAASHYGVLIDKCQQIENADTAQEIEDILNGNKIASFFRNIWDYEAYGKVTIDRHALATMLQTPATVKPLDDGQYSMTNKQYSQFEAIYQSIADEVGILPHQLQAVLWDTYRRLRDLKLYQHEAAPF